MSIREECWTCHFFHDESICSPEESCRFHESGQYVHGTCHRHSPVAAEPDEDDRAINYGYWPAVLSNDWCGEYERTASSPERSA